MWGYIYKTTNLINGKIYIGQHKSKSLNDSYLGSGLKIKRAINKYGKENFSKEILSVVESKFQADVEEKFYIKMFRDAFSDEFLYNIADGGQGGNTTKFWSDEYKIKHSEISKLGWSEERREEQAKRMQELNKNLDREKIAMKHRGLKRSEEAKMKISRSMIGKRNKRVRCLENNIIYDSIKLAAKELDLNASCISSVLSGKYAHTKGFHFEYEKINK